MNKTKLSFILIFVFAVSFQKAYPADKQDLRLHLFRGARHFFLITQNSKAIEDGDKVQVEQNAALKIEHQVLEQASNGNYKIEVSFRRFSLQINYQDKISRYDSDTVDVRNPFYKTLNFLTDIKIYYEISPEGLISNISGFEPIKKKIADDKSLGGLLRNFGNEVIITEFYSYLSPGAKAIGENWKVQSVIPDLNNLNYEIQYTLKEVTPKNLVLRQNASFKMVADVPKSPDSAGGKISEKGIQEGKLNLDPKTNLRVSSSLTQTIDVVATLNATGSLKSQEKPMKIITKTSYELVKK